MISSPIWILESYKYVETVDDIIIPWQKYKNYLVQENDWSSLECKIYVILHIDQ